MLEKRKQPMEYAHMELGKEFLITISDRLQLKENQGKLIGHYLVAMRKWS